MALKENQKKNAYYNNLQIKRGPFALISFYGLTTLIKQVHMALKEIAYPNNYQ